MLHLQSSCITIMLIMKVCSHPLLFCFSSDFEVFAPWKVSLRERERERELLPQQHFSKRLDASVCHLVFKIMNKCTCKWCKKKEGTSSSQKRRRNYRRKSSVSPFVECLDGGRILGWHHWLDRLLFYCVLISICSLRCSHLLFQLWRLMPRNLEIESCSRSGAWFFFFSVKTTDMITTFNSESHPARKSS